MLSFYLSLTRFKHYNWMNNIKWGIIGVGDVAEIKSGPAYQKTEGFEVVAVMRRNAEKVKDYAQRHGINQYYTDAQELIDDPNVDAIYIATPPDSHMEYALKVADAGKVCCIEKPMASTYDECLTIEEAFASKNLQLFTSYYRRSMPRFVQVKNWIDSGEIGDVRHVSWVLSQPPSDIDLSGDYNWRTDHKIATGGYFDDLASHGLDLFTFYLGDIMDCNGVATNQQNLYQAKDALSASWIHKNGVTGSAFWNFGSYSSEDRVEIYGSKGKIQFSIFHENPQILINDSGTHEMNIENPIHVQMPHVENMKTELIDQGAKHPSTGKSGLHTAWVMDQILK